MVTDTVLMPPLASDAHTPLPSEGYRLCRDRCVIEVSGRAGPMVPVRLRFKALSGTFTGALNGEPTLGPVWLEVQARPTLATPHIAGRYVPVRRSLAPRLQVVVTGASPFAGRSSSPATVEVSDGGQIGWRFPSTLRVVSQDERSVLVDLRGRLEPQGSQRRTLLTVWLRAAVEFTR